MLIDNNIDPAKGARNIAIIGSGPRGLSVLERMAARLIKEPPKVGLKIFLIDAINVGTGRIWRKNQPSCFVMNTVADEVSAFSGPLDKEYARPGAGPSLAEWWKSVDPFYPGKNSYASRALYGQYMEYVLSTIEKSLPTNVSIIKINSEVTDLFTTNATCHINLKNRDSIVVDKVVLTTGHSTNKPSVYEKELISFSIENKLRYIKSDSAADMPLDEIGSSNNVYIIGQGLSFFDVLSSLTEGRGGVFSESENGDLLYKSSGKEPSIFSGSRSGMIIPGRGKNQKHANYRYQPLIFTAEKVRKLCQKKPLSFLIDIFPLISAEINFIYYKTLIKKINGDSSAKTFEIQVLKEYTEGISIEKLRQLASKHIETLPNALNLDEFARPFDNQTFESKSDFEEKLVEVLKSDIALSMEGNVDSPVKAALDVIRDSRGLIREIVDFGGLTPNSHEKEFMDWYVPRSAFLSAGPPLYRIRQTIALINAGVLKVIGPNTLIDRDIDKKIFNVYSPSVKGSSQHVDTIVDARVPVMDLLNDESQLTQNLVKRGYWRPFKNCYAESTYQTGGVEVTKAPFHPINKYGAAIKELYVLGIPSEHTRWFMQAGSSRPGFWTDFFVDADAIAADILKLQEAVIEPENYQQSLVCS